MAVRCSSLSCWFLLNKRGVETAEVSRPSTQEPHVSESPRVRVGNSGSGFRHPDSSSGDRRFQRENTRTRLCEGLCMRPGRSRDPTIPNLDIDVDLEESFAERVPMLKSCPRFFRGRLRNSFRCWRSLSWQKEKAMSWQKNALGSSSLWCSKTNSPREENFS